MKYEKPNRDEALKPMSGVVETDLRSKVFIILIIGDSLCQPLLERPRL